MRYFLELLDQRTSAIAGSLKRPRDRRLNTPASPAAGTR